MGQPIFSWKICSFKITNQHVLHSLLNSLSSLFHLAVTLFIRLTWRLSKLVGSFPLKGSCEKHWPTEHMCYYNMAQMAICYNFAWSRWNATEGYRSIVMQMRVYNPELQTQKSQSLVLVTPSRAAFINCAEVTPVFCKDPIEGSKVFFYW